MCVGRLLDFSTSWDLIASLEASKVLMHSNCQLISLTQVLLLHQSGEYWA
jgi:hypothetical protein